MAQSLLIWGNTPLAGWLAAALHTRYQVSWLASDEIKTAVAANGLAIDNDTFRSINIITELEHKPDLIFLAMPGWGVADAVIRLRSFIPWDDTPPPLVSMQMGVGSLQRVETIFGAEHVLLAVITRRFHFARDENGNFLYHKVLSEVLSEKSGGAAVQAAHPHTNTVLQILRDVDLTGITADKDSLVWSSLFWGIQANALSAILDISPAEVYRNPEWFAYEHRQLVEALSIVRKLGVRLVRLPGVNVPLMARQVGWIPRRWVNFWLARHPRPPSLRDDLLHETGHSDAAYFNGAVAFHAHHMNLRTPLNHALALTVTDIAEKRMLWSEYKRRPELLHATLRLAQG